LYLTIQKAEWPESALTHSPTHSHSPLRDVCLLWLPLPLSQWEAALFPAGREGTSLATVCSRGGAPAGCMLGGDITNTRPQTSLGRYEQCWLSCSSVHDPQVCNCFYFFW